MGLKYPNSMSTFYLYLALTTSPNQWSSVKEEKCCSLQSKKGITAATIYNAHIFTKHKGRSQLVVPFREKNLIPPARGLPEGIDQHRYMMLCVYTKSQQCHALRTVQNAELSKETARKEPGYMPFVSHPVHKHLHLGQQKKTGEQPSVLFFSIYPSTSRFLLTATGGSPQEMCLQLCD